MYRPIHVSNVQLAALTDLKGNAMSNIDIFAEPRRSDPFGWWTNHAHITIDENRAVTIRRNGDLTSRDLPGFGLDAVLEDILASSTPER